MDYDSCLNFGMWRIWKEGNGNGAIYVPKLGASLPPFLLLSYPLWLFTKHDIGIALCSENNFFGVPLHNVHSIVFAYKMKR